MSSFNEEYNKAMQEYIHEENEALYNTLLNKFKETYKEMLPKAIIEKKSINSLLEETVAKVLIHDNLESVLDLALTRNESTDEVNLNYAIRLYRAKLEKI